jgi:hypothetical protein
MNATATAASRQRKPRSKPARSIRLTLKPFDGNPGVVRVTVGKEQADYFVTEIPADFGRGFKVEKMGDEAAAYHVNIDEESQSCECKGFARWHHCKHADGLAALVKANQL